MLNLKQIKDTYPKELQKFEKHILREYVQFKILEIIYSSKFGNSLAFMGGTALRIVYGNQRFSEDLDFDNLGLSWKNFKELSSLVQKGLEKQGLNVEIKNVSKAAFRCYVKISNLLYEENISPLENEKLTIQIDTFPQEYDFSPQIFTLDKFDVYTKIKVVPEETILAQKIFAAFDRKRKKGRDFFDISFLINNKKIKPDFNYLKEKIDIENQKELKKKLGEELKDVNFEKLAEKASVFLMNKKHKERVEHFYEDIDNWDFS